MTDHYILYSYWLQCDSCRVMQAVAICSPVMPFWYFGNPIFFTRNKRWTCFPSKKSIEYFKRNKL
jgi:hypothetical protein